MLKELPLPTEQEYSTGGGNSHSGKKKIHLSFWLVHQLCDSRREMASQEEMGDVIAHLRSQNKKFLLFYLGKGEKKISIWEERLGQKTPENCLDKGMPNPSSTRGKWNCFPTGKI